MVFYMVPGTGLEPAHRMALGSKPSMSTNSIIPAYWFFYNILPIIQEQACPALAG